MKSNSYTARKPARLKPGELSYACRHNQHAECAAKRCACEKCECKRKPR